MSEQMPLFNLPSTQRPPEAAQSDETVVPGDPVLREPGWALLGGSGRLWHRVQNQRYDGTLTAVCGATGRYILDVEHEIILCPTCEASSPSAP